MSGNAIDAVEQILNRGGEADAVLREVVTVLHQRLDRFVRISFVEGDGLVRGPSAGEEVARKPTSACDPLSPRVGPKSERFHSTVRHVPSSTRMIRSHFSSVLSR